MMSVKSRVGLVLALVFLPAAAEAARHAAELPFSGHWSGRPATCEEPFEFTANSYKPPTAEALPIRRFARSQAGYTFTFDDGYGITLSDVGPDRMTWTSLASGETIALTRCP